MVYLRIVMWLRHVIVLLLRSILNAEPSHVVSHDKGDVEDCLKRFCDCDSLGILTPKDDVYGEFKFGFDVRWFT